MTNQRKFEIADMRAAIMAEGASPARIAERLGCSRATVYKYLRQYPELKAAYEGVKGEPVEARKKFSRGDIEAAIRKGHGVKSAVAGLLGCSRQTVDNYLAEWPELAEAFEASRGGLIGKAVSALADDIDDKESYGHQRAYMFVLKTLAKDDGFTERSEVTGADGASLLDLSPETVQMIESMGMDISQVAKEFEAMVKAAAAQRGVLRK